MSFKKSKFYTAFQPFINRGGTFFYIGDRLESEVIAI